jgi:ribosomal protein S13
MSLDLEIKNSDNDNINDINIKKSKPTKKQFYEKERDVFINNLSKIIGIGENNNKNNIFLYEIENNKNIEKYLSDNIDNIKKYYKTGKWGFFSNDLLKGKNNYIGLLRSIYLDSDYEIISKLKVNTFNNVKKQYTEWDFRKKTYNL